ncbi:unnamed protein product [Prorocentrum cordatum]|uniref:Uncharacterized protein n=1 Tax=Prorocentrum cordatum TaxID=2364126 RepID=A0ABN9UK35_9DINO|nr:unnamed protein product [Polarella glacialis]
MGRMGAYSGDDSLVRGGCFVHDVLEICGGGPREGQADRCAKISASSVASASSPLSDHPPHFVLIIKCCGQRKGIWVPTGAQGYSRASRVAAEAAQLAISTGWRGGARKTARRAPRGAVREVG